MQNIRRSYDLLTRSAQLDSPSSLGQFSAFIAFQLEPKLSLGIEGGYAEIKGSIVDYQTATAGRVIAARVTTARIQLRANFTIASNNRLSFYFLSSVGLRRNRFYLDNIPVILEVGTGERRWSIRNLPIGVKPGLGLRINVTQKISLGSELCIGNPIVCTGLWYKIAN
jgi:hypothetical protein